MRPWWAITRYLRSPATPDGGDPAFAPPKGGLIAFGLGHEGIVHPGTDGQVPTWQSSATLGVTPGNAAAGTMSSGATNFDLIAPAATARGQMIAYSGTGWGALPAPPADGYGLVSSSVDPLGWTMVPFNYLSIPTTPEKLALEGFPASPSPSGTNLFLLSAGIGTTLGILQAWDADLDGLAALTQTGLVVRTGSGTYTANRLLNVGAGIIITFPNGIAGNPVISASVATTTGGSGGDYGRTVVKTADEGRLNNATAVVDGQLNLGSLPAGLWDISSHILYTADANVDFRLTIDHTVTAGVTLGWVYPSLDDITPRVRNVNLSLATNTPTAPWPNQGRLAEIRGTLWIHAGVTGDVFIKWGQITVSATLAATMHRGSFLRATPLMLY